jgi:hypothetical protein
MDVKESRPRGTGVGTNHTKVRKVGTRIPEELRNALFSIYIQTGPGDLATSN